MQVDPIKPTLKAPGSKRLKVEDEKLLSHYAFNFNLRRYVKDHIIFYAEEHLSCLHPYTNAVRDAQENGALGVVVGNYKNSTVTMAGPSHSLSCVSSLFCLFSLSSRSLVLLPLSLLSLLSLSLSLSLNDCCKALDDGAKLRAVCNHDSDLQPSLIHWGGARAGAAGQAIRVASSSKVGPGRHHPPRHFIRRVLKPRFLSQMTPYDVAGEICQALFRG